MTLRCGKHISPIPHTRNPFTSIQSIPPDKMLDWKKMLSIYMRMQNPNWEERNQAIRELADYRGKRAVTLLRFALQDVDYRNRRDAIEVLGTMRGHDVVKALRYALHDGWYKNYELANIMLAGIETRGKTR